MTTLEQLIVRAETAARCVYIAMDPNIADDLAHLIHDLLQAIAQLRQPWADIEKEFESTEGIDTQRLVHALCKRANGHRNQFKRMQEEIDALKREVASYANAHAVHIAERTALNEKLFRLQTQALVL